MTFKVYKSSAGSGKTFTLVKEYLNIALSSDSTSNYKGIMAVTFTNKAANEMKERVIKYLRAIAANEYADGAEKLIQQQLLESLKIKEGKLQERASKALKSILHNYSDFNISTID
ncbi:MAG: ATP-dependent helicase/nuclease subunit A, partial [Glaciecola sp.]